MGIILKEVAPTGDYIPDAFRRMYGRPFVYFQNLNTLFLGEPGMHHDDVLKAAGRPGYAGVVAYGDMGKKGIEWYRADEGVPKGEIAAMLGHPDKPASTDPAWHFANAPINVVKLDTDSGDHGSGRPIIYHPHSNTAYVGNPGSYHNHVETLLQKHGLSIPQNDLPNSPSHWRLGPDGMVDFYTDLSGEHAYPDDFKQNVIKSLEARGEHTYDRVEGTDWYFARTAAGFADTHPQDYDLPHQPETPQTPDDYWKAVTINGQHHVFPGDSKSHLQMVQDLGHTAHDVSDYWGWNPYMKKWESFNRFQQDYRDMEDANPQGAAWDFDLPTVAHVGASPVPKYIAPEEDDIRHLVTSDMVPGESDKGLELRDGTRLYWGTDGFGWPHHQEVAQALGITNQIAKFLDFDKGRDSEAWDF